MVKRTALMTTSMMVVKKDVMTTKAVPMVLSMDNGKVLKKDVHWTMVQKTILRMAIMLVVRKVPTTMMAVLIVYSMVDSMVLEKAPRIKRV
jgi:hypothetical protein